MDERWRALPPQLYPSPPPGGTFPTGTAAAAGLALIHSLSNLAGYVGPQVVAWLTGDSGDFGRALFALGLSMLTPAVVVRALRSKGLPARVPGNNLSAPVP